MKIFLVAGEESGDRLGAALMRSLKSMHGGPIEFSGVGGYEMAAEGLPSLFRIDDLSIVGFAAIPRRLPDDHQTDPPDLARRDRGAAGRHGDHRQSGFHPPRRAARAARQSVDSDRRLCVAVGLGLAAGTRPRHAALYRSRAGAASVRAGGAQETRRAALHLCRSSACRAGRRVAAERGGRNAAGMRARRFFWCCRAAAAARSSVSPSRSSARSSASPNRSGRSDIVIPTTVASCRCRHPRNGELAAAAAGRGQARGPARGIPARARGARKIRNRHAGTCRCRACRW